jgi:hypothetical protein
MSLKGQERRLEAQRPKSDLAVAADLVGPQGCFALEPI